ncbi:MAG TPA: YicC family protein [Candidatus Eubacterium faecavium]|nr:YicC family protein [Candidatus Eubacterium faecavium]
MIRSMTGFGRATAQTDGYFITVELKSVNHRYFDFNCRLPRQYGFAEEKLKAYINSRVSRGKIDCFLGVEALDTEDADVLVNHTLASAYVKALKELSQTYSLKDDFGTSAVSRFPDVFVLRKADEDEEKLWSLIQPVAEQAVDKFISMREAEGEKMRCDILSHAQTIIDNVSFIEERSPQTVKEYNEKLVTRVHELIGDVSLDESRIIQEVALFADKVAVAEETVRLRSHISQLRNFLNGEEPIGRKMDFLVQEINREANTIGSKACDVEIARRVVDIKAEIEKIREQIQNIE